MQNLGIDLGTTFTKTSPGRVFPSGVSENIYLSNNVMEIDGKKYAMGLSNHKCILDINIDKSLNRNVRLNYLYALHLEAKELETIYNKVCVGLPCSQWKNDNTVKKFKELLTIENIIAIKLNSLEKRIYVEELNVLPEGAAAYYSINYKRFDSRKVLICDWGGLTFNSLLFEDDQLVDLHTDEFGVLKVYKDMAEKITTETGIDIKMEDIFDILQYGLFHNGEIIDIEPIIRLKALEYCNQIYKNLKLKWGINTISYVLMIGAGSITMTKYLKEYIPHIELQPNAQLLAAIGMQDEEGD